VVNETQGVEPFVLFGLALCVLLIFVAFRTMYISDRMEMDRLVSELYHTQSQLDSISLEASMLRQTVEILTRHNIEVLAHLDAAHEAIEILSSV